MEELSTLEMLSLRGGADSVTQLALGNVALAMPINIVVFSGNAVGSGSKSSIDVIQNAAAAVFNEASFITQLL